MTPEEYAVHRERCLWLSEHPLTTRDLEDVDAGEDVHQRRLTDLEGRYA